MATSSGSGTSKRGHPIEATTACSRTTAPTSASSASTADSMPRSSAVASSGAPEIATTNSASCWVDQLVESGRSLICHSSEREHREGLGVEADETARAGELPGRPAGRDRRARRVALERRVAAAFAQNRLEGEQPARCSAAQWSERGGARGVSGRVERGVVGGHDPGEPALRDLAEQRERALVEVDLDGGADLLLARAPADAERVGAQDSEHGFDIVCGGRHTLEVGIERGTAVELEDSTTLGTVDEQRVPAGAKTVADADAERRVRTDCGSDDAACVDVGAVEEERLAARERQRAATDERNARAGDAVGAAHDVLRVTGGRVGEDEQRLVGAVGDVAQAGGGLGARVAQGAGGRGGGDAQALP